MDCILIQALNPTILVQVYNKDGPKERWDFLLEVYEKKTADRIQQLNREFCSISMEEDENIGLFISRVSNIVASLKACDKKVDDTMVIAQILEKLPDKFSVFVVAWSQKAADDQSSS